MSNQNDIDPDENIQLWADYDELFQMAVFLKRSGLGPIQTMTPSEVLYDIYTALSIKHNLDFQEVDAALDRMEIYNTVTLKYLDSVLSNRKH